MSNFRERLRALWNWFAGSADIKNAFHQMRNPGWLLASFALPPVLASEVDYTGKAIDRRRHAPDSLIHPFATIPMGFSSAIIFCQDVPDHCNLAGSADSPCFCRDHSTPPLLGSKHDMGSLGFCWSSADNFGVLARGANCTDVHLARLIAGVESPSRCGRHIPCQRKCRCSRL